MKQQWLHNVKLAFYAAGLSAGLLAAACEDSSTATDEETNVEQNLSALSELVGAKYILDIPSAQWTAPEGLGEEIVKGQGRYAFEVLNADASALTVTVRVGIVNDGEQDICNKTYTVAGTLNDEEMTFAIGPIDIESYLTGPGGDRVLGTCRDFTITGRIVEDGAALVSGAMTAELDAREIYPLFYLADMASGEELCAGAASYGTPCTECSFEAGVDLCLDFAAEEFSVFDSPDLTLAEITVLDESCE